MRMKARHRTDFEFIMRDKFPPHPFATDSATTHYLDRGVQMCWIAYQAAIINTNAKLRFRQESYEKQNKWLQEKTTANIRATLL